MDEAQIDNADTKNLIQTTNKELKTILLSLNKVVASQEQKHVVLYEGSPLEFELFDNITQNVKVKLKEKLPPCVLHFAYRDNRDLNVYISKIHKEPDEKLNQGSYFNVRFDEILMIILNIASQDSSKWYKARC